MDCKDEVAKHEHYSLVNDEMRKTIVITDVTQMPSGNEVCVVGIDTHGNSIRPVCEGGFRKNYLFDRENDVIIRHKARVQFDFHEVDIRPPHIEDMGFNIASIRYKGLCTDTEWEDVLQASSFNAVEDIYEGFLEDRGWVIADANTRSIATLSNASITDVELTPGNIKPRISFVDSDGNAYYRPSSDLTLWDRCRSLVKRQDQTIDEVQEELLSLLQTAERIYLRLGLARPWEREEGEDERCWLQITGLHTFPDYLYGKCFANFS